MGRWARKTDDNHQEIMDAFRALGFSVADTSRLGNGFPDLVVAKKGINVLVEVKDGNKPPSAKRLTQDEKDFMQYWLGEYTIIETSEGVEMLNKSIISRG